MIDAVGKPIEVGSQLAVASRRQSSAYLSRQKVTEIETRPLTRWNRQTNQWEPVEGLMQHRLTVELGNGRNFVHDWQIGDEFSRAIVIGG